MDIIYKSQVNNHLIERIVFVGFVVSSMPLGVVVVDVLPSVGGILSADYHYKGTEDSETGNS